MEERPVNLTVLLIEQKKKYIEMSFTVLKGVFSLLEYSCYMDRTFLQPTALRFYFLNSN